MAKIFVGFPHIHKHMVHNKVLDFLYNLQNRHQIQILNVVKTPITVARNRILQEFIKTDNDYLLFIDDDNPPIRNNIIDKMIQSDQDICTAWIRKRIEPNDFAQYKKIENTYGINYISYKEPFTGYVDLTGCGFLLIKRKVIEHILFKYLGFPFERKIIHNILTKNGWEELEYISGGFLSFIHINIDIYKDIFTVNDCYPKLISENSIDFIDIKDNLISVEEKKSYKLKGDNSIIDLYIDKYDEKLGELSIKVNGNNVLLNNIQKSARVYRHWQSSDYVFISRCISNGFKVYADKTWGCDHYNNSEGFDQSKRPKISFEKEFIPIIKK